MRGLAVDLVNEEFPAILVEVMQARPRGCKYVVRLEANHIVEESAELVHLALHLDVGARILLEERVVLMYLQLELGELVLELVQDFSLLQDF